jgi:hypothetical protein
VVTVSVLGIDWRPTGRGRDARARRLLEALGGSLHSAIPLTDYVATAD